jgi:toxin-antitoxin system PIN domain toxin
MVDLLDANILIGAFREDVDGHAEVKAWLEAAIAQEQPLSFPALVEVAFLRVVTHPNIFRVPSSLEEAVRFLAALQASGCVQACPWTSRIRRLMLRRAAELNLRGNDLNDASLAAIAEAMQWRLVSCDQGFARFRELQWLNPVAPR